MKTFPLLLIMGVMVLFTQSGYAQQTAQQALTEAQRDFIRGDFDAAKERFAFVLELDPSNLTAQNYLHIIEVKEAANGKNSTLEKALNAMVLPHVQLKAATLDTALEYLKQTADKISDGKTKVNFVVEIPDDVLSKARVSLDLSSVPFTEVLRYVSEQTGFKFKIDQYAITVKQASAPAPVSTTPDTPAAPDTSMSGSQ